jgi:hypothetical protein
MKYIRVFEQFTEETIDLYHGTSAHSAELLCEYGWKPSNYGMGGNGGQSRYLYLSSMREDALWFAEEKGESSVVVVKNIPISHLIFDTEDGDYDREVYRTVSNAVAAIKGGLRHPIKLTLTKPLDASHFEQH